MFDENIKYVVCTSLKKITNEVECYKVMRAQTYEVVETFQPEERDAAYALARELTLKDRENES